MANAISAAEAAQFIQQYRTALALSAMDDDALAAAFGHDGDEMISFLGSFSLAFDATRVADLADEIESRMIALLKAEAVLRHE